MTHSEAQLPNPQFFVIKNGWSGGWVQGGSPARKRLNHRSLGRLLHLANKIGGSFEPHGQPQHAI